MTKLEIPIKGIKYRVTPGTWTEMVNGAPLKARIEREPDNEHDPNAVRVFVAEKPWKGFHIGYLPRDYAATISAKLRRGRIEIAEAWIQADDPESYDAILILHARKLAQSSQISGT